MKIFNKQWDELREIPNIEKSMKIKNELVDEIADTLQEAYFNRSKGVKGAIDEMCFLAKEKGFAFASPTYYMNKFDIKKDAVYSAVKALINANLVVRCNRSSSKHNGLGGWVLIFRSHPNFEAISSILNLTENVKEKAEPKVEQKAEIAEIPCESKVESEENVSTYQLPTNTQNLNNNVLHLNVSEPSKVNKSIIKFAKYVPKKINEMFVSIFGKDLTELWRKVTLATKKIGFEIDKETKNTFGIQVLRALFEHIKINRVAMSLDEMCAYVYTTTRGMIYNSIGAEFIEDMVYEEDEFGNNCYYYSSVESETGYCRTHKSKVDLYEEYCKRNGLPFYNWLDEIA